MQNAVNYTDINESKANFDSLYTSNDPREYFKLLGRLDYIIPHVAQPIFAQLIRERAAQQSGPVTILDLGCSYGVNGALMKYDLDYESLRSRYTAPALQHLSSEELLALDQAYFRSWPKNRNVQVIGHDISENAVRYAQSVGTVDVGLPLDLEERDPTPEQAELLRNVDLIVSTGCVGYVTSKTFARVARYVRAGRTPWVASFVLRMFPYDDIAATLDDAGLETERFDGATFVQRRFAGRAEMEAVISTVEGRGIDTRGHEVDGLYHAELFVSRPQEEIERLPLQKMITVVSGANKPWTVGTNVLGSFGSTARNRARAERPHLTLAKGTGTAAGR